MSLADAQQIVAACAGPNWRDRFELGLATALALVVVAAAVWWTVRR
jgi:hypothetical protein